MFGISWRLEVKNSSAKFQRDRTHNCNIFPGTFVAHDSAARALPRVPAINFSPTKLEDKDGITHFLFPVDFR